MTKHLVFVCVSNTCRSPMAEHLCRKKLKARGIEDFTVYSRSISTDYEPEGSPASENGVVVMREKYGLDLTEHRSTLLRQDDFHHLYALIPVKHNITSFIERRFRLPEEKFMYFKHDVPDPWHQPLHVFEQCAEDIDELLDDLIDRLLHSHK